ncbi:SAM-dependent methyltransferase [Sungkyunkwania multivorans]|uniref:SAM-dependent methyltransferase n=1 Tax=Sungkyunkwania multivorans TaxID=1173618 RepID=A0ABW3CYF1_9FLAO
MDNTSPTPLGKLYLIPTRLGQNPPLEVLPMSIKRIVEIVDDYIMENEKVGRAFVKAMVPGKSQPSLNINTINKFTDPIEMRDFLDPCMQGRHMGILSDAGCPGIADPGADIVRMAHQKGIQVVPLVGPSSILMAMMSSGMNGQSFCFNGYLPIDKMERKRALKGLEKLSKEKNQSQLFIETPYRNDKLLADITSNLQNDTLLCVACDITLPTEYIKTMPIKEWKHTKVDLHKRPAIFIIHAG